jgi:hypothetical protein
MTRYEKELACIVAERYGNLSATQLVAQLCRIGVIDHTLCKVLAVRRYVEEAVKEGSGRMAAMWLATGHFSVTFEYVRKCIYYYRDVNI